jgi:EKC/KEOPS complex subunit CGI121/TPRKB
MTGLVDFPSRIQLGGFSDVSNCADLVSLTTEHSRVAIVDLSMVWSSLHINAAICKALLNEQSGCMKTKSISAEILYQLSPTTKINDSLKQFGASPASTLIAIVVLDQDSVGKDILARVSGEPFDLEKLSSPEYATMEKSGTIAKYFKLSSLELQVSSLECALLTHLATKDCL